MDRKLVIGVGAVAVLGGALAVLAVFASGVPQGATDRSAPVESASAPRPLPGPRRSESAPPAPSEEAAATVERPSSPRVGPPPEIFQPLEEDHDRLLHQPLFEDLGPTDEPAEIAAQVDEVLEEVHDLARTYLDVAKTPDVGVRNEALNRAAMLYDHLAERLPPPALADPGSPPGWTEEDREALVADLRRKAEGLRMASQGL